MSHMTLFHSLLPDVAADETRSVTILNHPDLPKAQYGFIESYCDDPACDCRRVLISVISPEMPGKILATINYGWESLAFYTRWMHNASDAEQARGATLDPLNPQSALSPALLRLFETVLQDQAYVERLKRHYTLFKQALRAKRPPKPVQHRARPRRRR